MTSFVFNSGKSPPVFYNHSINPELILQGYSKPWVLITIFGKLWYMCVQTKLPVAYARNFPPWMGVVQYVHAKSSNGNANSIANKGCYIYQSDLDTCELKTSFCWEKTRKRLVDFRFLRLFASVQFLSLCPFELQRSFNWDLIHLRHYWEVNLIRTRAEKSKAPHLEL